VQNVLTIGATGVVTYVNDCYRDKAPEALAGPVALKNIFTFALTFYINVWRLVVLELDDRTG
jgi:hypothetical protein